MQHDALLDNVAEEDLGALTPWWRTQSHLNLDLTAFRRGGAMRGDAYRSGSICGQEVASWAV